MRTDEIVEVIEVEPVWAGAPTPGTVPVEAPAGVDGPAGAGEGRPDGARRRAELR
ncbi:MAG: hypothetical protein M3N68_00920 [Actinomycetota bacterium]|nr:hypothetical protein [Actinomycetota bacterium]